MPSATGQNWEKYQKKFADDEEPEKKITPLTDESVADNRGAHSVANTLQDIQVLKTYGAAPYAAALKRLEKDIKEKQTSVNEKIGVKVLEIALLWSAQPD
jgi:26S proteasome regulatory subunit T1